MHPDALFTLDEWCAINRVSRREFYNMQKRGEGPALLYIGKLPRISQGSNRAWQAALPTQKKRVA
jgi:hypothetical protein